MKAKEFNALKKEVKKGNLKGLKKEVISSLTLSQAQAIEDLMLDLELDEEKNHILDEVVNHIDSLVMEEKKVANKKAPAKTKPEPKKPAKTEPAKTEKTKKVKLFNKVEVGDVVKFRVEGEEVKHDIRIIYKGINHIVGIMVEDEREVFVIRKTDFNKGVFEWIDRKGETYNIIVTL